jgi:hypothetical protein
MVEDAVSSATKDRSMCPDAMALAILSQNLRTLSTSRSRTDLESYIDYDLNNIVDSDMVITRAC